MKQGFRSSVPTRRRWAALLLCLWPVVTPSPHAQPDESTVKAVFLERFTRFIEWPDSCNVGAPSQTFVIGLAGDSPLGRCAREIYATRRIRGMGVEVRVIHEPREMDGCHLLLLAESERRELAALLTEARRHAVLTVSDAPGFAAQGVLINLYEENGHIRFEINESVLRESGLAMSHLLLGAARIVEPVGGGDR